MADRAASGEGGKRPRASEDAGADGGAGGGGGRASRSRRWTLRLCVKSWAEAADLAERLADRSVLYVRGGLCRRAETFEVLGIPDEAGTESYRMAVRFREARTESATRAWAARTGASVLTAEPAGSGEAMTAFMEAAPLDFAAELGVEDGRRVGASASASTGAGAGAEEGGGGEPVPGPRRLLTVRWPGSGKGAPKQSLTLSLDHVLQRGGFLATLYRNALELGDLEVLESAEGPGGEPRHVLLHCNAGQMSRASTAHLLVRYSPGSIWTRLNWITAFPRRFEPLMGNDLYAERMELVRAYLGWTIVNWNPAAMEARTHVAWFRLLPDSSAERCRAFQQSLGVLLEDFLDLRPWTREQLVGVVDLSMRSAVNCPKLLGFLGRVPRDAFPSEISRASLLARAVARKNETALVRSAVLAIELDAREEVAQLLFPPPGDETPATERELQLAAAQAREPIVSVSPGEVTKEQAGEWRARLVSTLCEDEAMWATMSPWLDRHVQRKPELRMVCFLSLSDVSDWKLRNPCFEAGPPADRPALATTDFKACVSMLCRGFWNRNPRFAGNLREVLRRVSDYGFCEHDEFWDIFARDILGYGADEAHPDAAEDLWRWFCASAPIDRMLERRTLRPDERYRAALLHAHWRDAQLWKRLMMERGLELRVRELSSFDLMSAMYNVGNNHSDRLVDVREHLSYVMDAFEHHAHLRYSPLAWSGLVVKTLGRRADDALDCVLDFYAENCGRPFDATDVLVDIARMRRDEVCVERLFARFPEKVTFAREETRGHKTKEVEKAFLDALTTGVCYTDVVALELRAFLRLRDSEGWPLPHLLRDIEALRRLITVAAEKDYVAVIRVLLDAEPRARTRHEVLYALESAARGRPGGRVARLARELGAARAAREP